MREPLIAPCGRNDNPGDLDVIQMVISCAPIVYYQEEAKLIFGQRLDG